MNQIRYIITFLCKFEFLNLIIQITKPEISLKNHIEILFFNLIVLFFGKNYLNGSFYFHFLYSQ